jgi:hypothetical protein
MNSDSTDTLNPKSEGRHQGPQDQWLWIIQELFIDVFSRLGAGGIFFLWPAWP